MSKEKNIHKAEPLTANKLWPVILSLGKEQMEALYNALSNHLYPWPDEKLTEIHQQIKEGKILSEADFQKRFAKYISSK